MDELERQILSSFDGLRGAARDLADFTDAPSRDAVRAMIDRGWLRPGEAPGSLERTDQGRLQLAGPLDVSIYSRPGCHLCDEAKHLIAPLLSKFGGRLTEINIDEDAQLRERYDYDVPVIFLGARKIAKHRVDHVQLERQLREAARG